MADATSWGRRHARTVLFVLTVLAAAGVVAATHIPAGLFPRASFPRVVISLDAGDRAVDRMGVEVTAPVESAVRAVPGVRRIRSATRRGSADVSVNFAWGTDMVAATLQVESAIAQARSQLPDGVVAEVRRMDTNVFPVLAYSLTSDERSLTELRDVALYDLRPRLLTVPGVASIGVEGGDEAEFHVVVDPGRLRAMGLTLDDVAAAVGASNDTSAMGRAEDLGRLYLVLSDSRFHSAEEIATTVIQTGSGGVVQVKEVATVEEGVAPRWTRVRADGHRAVLLQVYQQRDGDTLAIARAVQRELAAAEDTLPSGIRVANWYDQTELIRAAASGVRDALITGVVLAFIVLLIFLRSARVAAMAVLSVPLTLAVTSLLLFALGQSFNLMTLGGMAAAVGLIIDDSLVMVEHVVRRVAETDQPSAAALPVRVLHAAREFTRPLLGSSAVTVIVFTPMAFLSGVTGEFFRPLALTIAVSLSVSFLIAWVAVPLATGGVLARRPIRDRSPGGPIARAYTAALRAVLRHPWTALVLLVPLLWAGWIGLQRTGSGFMPSMDEGGFVLDYVNPPGTSLTETDRVVQEVEQVLRETPEVKTYSYRTGLALAGSLTEANEGDFFIRLVPPPRRAIDEVMDDVRERLRQRVPGIEIEMAQLAVRG